MKRIWIPVGVVVAGALLMLRQGEDPPPPPMQHVLEEGDAPPAPPPEPVRSEIPAPEQPPTAAPETDEPADGEHPPVVPEPPPAWINEESFVAAGLSREQAAELVEGMRRLHREVPILRAIGNRSASDLELQALMMLELGPRLADRIKDGSITFQWTPRLRPEERFVTNGFAWNASPDSAEPWSYTAHGRIGWLDLQIPRRLCDPDLLKRVVAASSAK